jgi:hypothetical protein
VTFGVLFARNGKSFLDAIPSRHDVTIYRQNWQAGKLVGQPVALKLPFAFPLISAGNAYDFSRSFYGCLCATGRSRGLISSEPKIMSGKTHSEERTGHRNCGVSGIAGSW